MSNLFDQLSKNHKPLEPVQKRPQEESKKVVKDDVHDATFAILISMMSVEGQ